MLCYKIYEFKRIKNILEKAIDKHKTLVYNVNCSRGSGGTGRRARLRGVWFYRTGSIPVSRTKKRLLRKSFFYPVQPYKNKRKGCFCTPREPEASPVKPHTRRVSLDALASSAHCFVRFGFPHRRLIGDAYYRNIR